MNNRRGLSLLEALISIVLLTVVIVGAQAALLISVRAMPLERQAPTATAHAGRALDLIMDDLAYAIVLTLNSETDVTMDVPDRDGDLAAETIRYFWSNGKGDALYRQVNEGQPTALINDVQQFGLVLEKRAIPQPITYSESDEIVFSQLSTGLVNADARIQSGNWVAQYIKPNLPANASHYRMTRVAFRARVRGGTGGETAVQIRMPSGSGMSNIILDETTFLESSLASSYEWREVTYGDVFKIPAASGAWIVFKWLKDSDACELQFRNALLSITGNMATSSNSGTSWSNSTGNNVIHYIYGRYATPDPVAPRYVVTGVRCTLRAAAGAPVTASTRVWNEPEVE